jgi:hypothetical protein
MGVFQESAVSSTSVCFEASLGVVELRRRKVERLTAQVEKLTAALDGSRRAGKRPKTGPA